MFIRQKTLYLQKLAADFEVIRKLVDRKYIELKDKIETVYDDNLRQAYRSIDGLSAMKTTINTVQTQSTLNKFDIDQMHVNNTLNSQIREIQVEFDFEVQTKELDLIDSKFTNEPF